MAKKHRDNNSKVSVSDQNILDAMTELSEDEFTKTIIQPLLNRLGFNKVDYTGGPNEHGRDLIGWKKDEFDTETITVFQIKKTKITARAKSQSNYTEIITQLTQALEVPVLTYDGKEMMPCAAAFITPYALETRSIENLIAANSLLKKQTIRILDGPRIIDLLKTKAPDILANLGFQAIEWRQKFLSHINNDPLMHALQAKKKLALWNFYVDVSFAMCNKNNQTLEVRETCQIIEVPFSCVDAIVANAKLAYSLIGISWFDGDIDKFMNRTTPEISQIKRRWEKSCALNKKLNTTNLLLNELKSKLSDATQELTKLQSGINVLISDAKHKLKNNEAALAELIQDAQDETLDQEGRRDNTILIGVREKSISDIESEIKSLSAFDYSVFYAFSKLADDFRLISLDGIRLEENTYAINYHNGTDKSDISKKIDKYLETHKTQLGNVLHKINRSYMWCKIYMTDLRAAIDSYTKIKAQIDKINMPKSEPTIGIPINTTQVSNFFNSTSKRLKNLASKINETCNSAHLGVFVKDHAKLAKLLDLLQIPELSQHILVNKSTTPKTFPLRLNISIHDVFDLRKNIVVVGEAGSGKTTSLMMYYKKKSEIEQNDNTDIFVPLGRLARVWAEKKSGETPKEYEGILSPLSLYLHSIGIQCDAPYLKNIFTEKRTLVMFDGLDEGIKHCPWLIEEIAKFAQDYPKTHLIISSRIVGNTWEPLPFPVVKLMDFTSIQQEKFINLWFSDEPEKALRIRDHLNANPTLSEVVSNPLLATILCVLVDHDVHLPISEPQLYDDRFRLLAGELDPLKGVPRRTDSRIAHLRTIACAIAYAMHEEGTREWPFSKLVQTANDVAVRSQHQGFIGSKIIDELIDPCNIILNTGESQFGFGHLRFQEHLCALAIVSDRTLKVEQYFGLDWWHDVFVLAAKMCTDPASLIDWLKVAGNQGRTRRTVAAMSEVLPETYRKSFLEEVEAKSYRDHILDEIAEEDILEFEDDDEDYFYQS